MKFTTFALSALALAGAVSAWNASPSREKIQYFATTDMTWAEFYAGELGEGASTLEENGYDAMTSATKQKTKRYTQCVVTEDGAQITGVARVGVGMTAKVYKKLSAEQKKRFTFVKDSVFPAYKTLDAKGNFGKYTAQIAKVDTVQPKILSGGTSSWGNYTLQLSGLRLKEKVLGVVLTTQNGEKFGLKPLENIWLNAAELGFCVEDFVEPRGSHPGYRHTEGLQGKTIVNVTYIMLGAPEISIDVNLPVKTLSKAKIEIAEAKAGDAIKVQVNGLPAGYRLTEVRYREGRKMNRLTSEQFSLQGSELALKGNFPAATYTAIFQHDELSDLSAPFFVTE